MEQIIKDFVKEMFNQNELNYKILENDESIEF